MSALWSSLAPRVGAVSDGPGFAFLEPLASALGWMIGQIDAVVHSYGLAIVLLAIGLRLVLLPLSLFGARKQRYFQRRRVELAPRLAEIKEAAKGDADKEYQDTMALYREHGLSPTDQLKGCLPLFIQLPLLLALYQLLSSSPEVAGKSFLWIADLSKSDALFGLGVSLPYFGSAFNLLPFLMFAAQLDIARTMGASKAEGEPRGAWWSQLALPVVMLILFYPFPAGCMLYWTVSNIGQALEQRLFLRE